MQVNRYILKFAIGVALAFAIGNALHSRSITYILYGATLCIHPIAGDTIGYSLDKVKSAALGASVGMVLTIAFQGNQFATLAVGPTALLVGGYWFGVAKRLLMFSTIVIIVALGAPYSLEPAGYIGLRFWNLLLGCLVGIVVNLAFWPARDMEKLDPAFARAIASIHELYNRIIDDYQQGRLAANTPARQQLRNDIERQFGAIDTILGNAKNELWSPFTNASPYQRWSVLQARVKSLFLLVANLDFALKGGDRDTSSDAETADRLYQFMQAELEALVQETRNTFDYFSQTPAFQGDQSSTHLLANLPELKKAIRDRFSQIDRAGLPADLDLGEVKRVTASIYGLGAIASALGDLATAMEPSSSSA